MIRRLASGLLKLVGWRIVGEAPAAKSVIIGAPHTSNWDFPLALLCLWSVRIPAARWVGKHTIFRWPVGLLLRRLGGIPVDRAHTTDFVRHIVEAFEREPEFTLLLAPEGTRSRRDHWRSGFYWIAHRAAVPLALGFVDYADRKMGIGDVFMPSGDMEADLERIRAFYADKKGRYPEKQSSIRVRPH